MKRIKALLTKQNISLLGVVVAVGAIALYFITKPACSDLFRNVMDEARCVDRMASTLPGADEDYFADMDYGVSHTPDVIYDRLSDLYPDRSEEELLDDFVRGRNNWIVWTAGNDAMWDKMVVSTAGNVDFLKILTNHPSQQFNRDNRWEYYGLVNEPCFVKGDTPREDRYGLYLDRHAPGCEPDPFENAEKYPGVEIGARGDNIEVGSYYGYGTGIVGLRLFPNPDFDARAEARWDPERYYTDRSYYEDSDLVRPYRVGMSCGFCHVGPNPSNPPADPNAPEWANLNSNPGAQYYWVSRVFLYDTPEDNFAQQLFHTSRPGALDTSLIATDYNNNPRTMNALYRLKDRALIGAKWGSEQLTGGGLNNKQFNDTVSADSPLNGFYQAPRTVLPPRVLKDGADSVGITGALNRVFINIGLFSEYWTRQFLPIVGGGEPKPFEIEYARANSSYWNATEAQTPDLAAYFLAATEPDLLENAPGGTAYLTEDEATLDRGKVVYAEYCANCHSSKLPDRAFTFFDNSVDQVEGCAPFQNYLDRWNCFFNWTLTDPAYKAEITQIVLADDFLDDNYLGNELRMPVTDIESNVCAPIARNALEDHIWDNFSSDTYKNLPSVGTVEVQLPWEMGTTRQFELPAGGRGYMRPPSLVSIWSNAPYLLNNTVGVFNYTGSVADRMDSYDDSMRKLLWPELREGAEVYGQTFMVRTRSGMTHPGVIDVTTVTSELTASTGFLPRYLRGITNLLLPEFLRGPFGGDVSLGPIPQGTPVNLISNIDLENAIRDDEKRRRILDALEELVEDLKELNDLPGEPTDDEARQVFGSLRDQLWELSSCPDFVVNKGHYYGTEYFAAAELQPGLSDADKEALIAYMKRF